jgi:hypothetical protein
MCPLLVDFGSGQQGRLWLDSLDLLSPRRRGCLDFGDGRSFGAYVVVSRFGIYLVDFRPLKEG